MARITTVTGKEWHTSAGIVAQVFVREVGTETPLYQWPKAKLIEQEWEDVQRGKHGKYCKSEYDVPTGTVLKVWFAYTYKGRPERVLAGYFRVTGSDEYMRITGPVYAGRGGELKGAIEQVLWEECEAWIGPKYKRYYKLPIEIKRDPLSEEGRQS